MAEEKETAMARWREMKQRASRAQTDAMNAKPSGKNFGSISTEIGDDETLLIEVKPDRLQFSIPAGEGASQPAKPNGRIRFRPEDTKALRALAAWIIETYGAPEIAKV